MQQQEFLINDLKQKKSVFSKLNYLLRNDEAIEVTFMVAFITVSGIYLILNELRSLLARKVKVVIITGFMNNFNTPKVFELLKRIEDLEIRIANIQEYHPKLYIIKTKHGKNAYIIGSSNLTNNALRANLETNIYFEQEDEAGFTRQIAEFYDQIYADSKVLTDEMLEQYRINCYKKLSTPPAQPLSIVALTPNLMQQKALTALNSLRQQRQTKALVISATGSGKTYLSAFDVKAFNPKRLLFIAHRENILNAAITSYISVIENCNPGKLTGETKDINRNFIFTTIQTLHKDNYLHLFDPKHFDYIIIDEVHRVGAKSYQKILSYFQPEFLLGMSATPERNDDFDIYKLFDNNIAYEIRLNEALEEDLVCPFHYFGIAELMIDNTCLNDYSDFNKINFKERVDHIITHLKLYGYSGNKPKGLIFTSRIEEAQKLTQIFNQRGYKTISLSGIDSEAKREAAIKLLANDYTDGYGQPQEYLDYIFSVDIFNEGIDIPWVNQIILLRPTQSAIIFTQQIGRGLRKAPNKEYCVILDFIGNYNSNFLIAVALSGNNSYDRESLRHFVNEANSMIPVNATVSFDQITRDAICFSINKIQISKKFVNQNYLELKRKLNKVPELIDFKHHNSIDPKLIFKHSGKSAKIIYSSYYELLKAQHDIDDSFTPKQCNYLAYISQELLFASRPDELFILLALINGVGNEELIYASLAQEYNTIISEAKLLSMRKVLNLETSAALHKKYALTLIDDNSTFLQLDNEFREALKGQKFKDLIIQTIKLGLSYFDNYKSAIRYGDFVLYDNYNRKETVRLLNVNLSMETSIYGYRIINNNVPIFIAYNKVSAAKTNARYVNMFLNNQNLIWYSKPFNKEIPTEARRIIEHKKNNLTLMIFVKKSDNETGEHYYLGNADVSTYQIEQLNQTKKVLKFTLHLHTPLADSYLDYFIN